MRRRSIIRRQDENKNRLFHILMAGFVIVLLFTYSFLFPMFRSDCDKSYKNTDITFFDNSLQMENPSGKVIIDGLLVYQIDSISKSLYQDVSVNLKKGKHILKISTIDDRLKLTDTIEVEIYPMKYKLWIRYNYNPSLSEYKKILIEYAYQKKMKNKSYMEDQKKELLKQVTEEINKELENNSIYEPSKRCFTFTFLDITNYIIE